MNSRTALWLLPLAIALSACVPRQGAGVQKVLLVPGGRIVGNWAELPEGAFPLPGPPLFADRAEGVLYLAYPYELLTYQNGELVASETLPGVPTFLHALPRPVVGTTAGVYAPGRDLPPYPARDARLNQKLWWTDGAAHQDGRFLDPGPFRRVVADRERVAFLGEEAYFPEGTRFKIPPFRGAGLMENLYLLTDRGVLRYAPNGLLIDQRTGRYRELAVGDGKVWLLDLENRVIQLDADLKEVP